MKIPKYKKLDPKDIKPNKYNPNEMAQSQLDNLVKEIKDKGFLQPILINEDNIIVDGEHRWMAAIEAGMKQVPCFVMKINKSDAKVKTVNMNAIKGDTSPLKLAELIEDLSQDFTKTEIAAQLFMTELEIESYLDLLTFPDIDLTDVEEAKPATISCPNCGHEFER